MNQKIFSLFSTVLALEGENMDMRYMSIAVFVAVVVLAMVLNPIVAYAKVVKTYDLTGSDAVVFHRSGFTLFKGFLNTTRSFVLNSNFTVCVRITSGLGYSSVQPVVDYGISGTNTFYWRIEAVPVSGLTKFNYRFSLSTSNGVVSVDVPGEMYKFHMYCFGVTTFSNNSGVINAYVDGNLSNSVRFSGSVNMANPATLFIGAYANITYLALSQPIWMLPTGRNTTITLLLLYNRSLTVSTETVANMTIVHNEYADVANGFISSIDLVLYFDPTVVDWINNVWVDLSSSGNNLRLNGFLMGFVDNETFYVLVARYNDNYVHFQYFPWYSRIEIYNAQGSYYEKDVIQGADNGFGEVIEYDVSIPASSRYTIVYYDPNENITVTTTVVSAALVISYRTTTTTVTVAGATVKFDWIVLAAMLIVFGVSLWYLLHKKR